MSEVFEDKKWILMSEHEKYMRGKAKWQKHTLRLDFDDTFALKVMALKKNMPVSELLRTFVTWGLENG